MNIVSLIAKILSIASFKRLEEKSSTVLQPPSPPAKYKLTQTKSANTQTSRAAELTREIRSQRKFTLAEAISRESGSFMKGESAIPRPLRAATEISQFITARASQNSPVSTTLQHWAKEDIRVARHLDSPLIALSQIIQSILEEPITFQEFFRQIAIAQSQISGDRPYFQQPGQPPHPNAAYCHQSVKQQLLDLQHKLQQELE